MKTLRQIPVGGSARVVKLYGEAKIADGRVYAKDLKDRYSVLWMLYDLYGDNARNV